MTALEMFKICSYILIALMDFTLNQVLQQYTSLLLWRLIYQHNNNDKGLNNKVLVIITSY